MDADHASSEPELPHFDFTTLVLSFSHSALVHLGDAPGLEGKAQVELPLARQSIDILAMLQEKTKGNLTADEERLIQQVLCDLRLRFVEVSRSHPKG